MPRGIPIPLSFPLCGSVRVTRSESGEEKTTLSFIGRSDTPLWRGRTDPSATKAARSRRGKFLPDESLILGKLKGLRQLFLVARPIETGVLHTGRKEVKEDLLKLCSVNGSPVGRKTYMETENQYSVAWCADLAGCPGEDFLTAAAYGKETALSGTFRLETELWIWEAKRRSKWSSKAVFVSGVWYRSFGNRWAENGIWIVT